MSWNIFFQAQARDPKYKTAICEAWKSNGTCDRGSNCIYAHGQSDLRQKSQMSMPPMTNMTTAYPPQYGGKLIILSFVNRAQYTKGGFRGNNSFAL